MNLLSSVSLYLYGDTGGLIMEGKRKFTITKNKTDSMHVSELKQGDDIRKLEEENKKLKHKLNTIDDYYQEKIAKLNEEWQSEMNAMIKKYEDEIKDLKSRALVNPRKITDEQVNEVKRLRATGLSYRKIAKETALGTATIGRIVNGEYDK